jgi:hypothetical protein
MEHKLVELGAKPSKKPKAPFPMRLGMIKAEEKRSQKRLQTAKDMGLYHSSLRNQILAGGDKAKVDEKKKKTGGGGKRGDLKEVNGFVGRFSDGVLHVPKALIAPKKEAGPRRGGGGGLRKGGGGGSGGKKGKKFKKKK